MRFPSRSEVEPTGTPVVGLGTCTVRRLTGAGISNTFVLASTAMIVIASTTMGVADAQDRAVRRADVIRLARRRAPDVVAAMGRIEEARAERVGASLRLTDNPTLSGTAGPRWLREGLLPQVEVGIEQSFALGGRGARLDAVRAAVERTRAEAGDVMRAVLAEALEVFVLALDAHARVGLADQTERVASDLVEIAERRQAAGDVSAVDVELARAAVSRARSAHLAAEADGLASAGGLAALLGLTGSIAVEGDITESPAYGLDELVATARHRPDLQALRAEMREASARFREGEAAALPRLTVGLSYELDEGDDLALGTLGVALPFFDRGAGTRAVARARRRRAALALGVAERAVTIELRGLLRSYDAHRRAVSAAGQAVQVLSQAEPLLVRAYAAGETSLGDVLTIRREVLDARVERLDRARELAFSRIRLEAAAGVLR